MGVYFKVLIRGTLVVNIIKRLPTKSQQKNYQKNSTTFVFYGHHTYKQYLLQ